MCLCVCTAGKAFGDLDATCGGNQGSDAGVVCKTGLLCTTVNNYIKQCKPFPKPSPPASPPPSNCNTCKTFKNLGEQCGDKNGPFCGVCCGGNKNPCQLEGDKRICRSSYPSGPAPPASPPPANCSCKTFKNLGEQCGDKNGPYCGVCCGGNKNPCQLEGDKRICRSGYPSTERSG